MSPLRRREFLVLSTGTAAAYMHDIARYMETQISAVIYGIAVFGSGALRTNVRDYYPHQMITGRYWADVWLSE